MQLKKTSLALANADFFSCEAVKIAMLFFVVMTQPADTFSDLFEQESFSLERDDLLFLATDGIVEDKLRTSIFLVFAVLF